ncbi:hypothetical protein D0T87_12840 [Bacteroides sp. 51]|nr:hypothetical protein [Bacteroides sp. 51]
MLFPLIERRDFPINFIFPGLQAYRKFFLPSKQFGAYCIMLTFAGIIKRGAALDGQPLALYAIYRLANYFLLRLP